MTSNGIHGGIATDRIGSHEQSISIWVTLTTAGGTYKIHNIT